MSGTDLRRPETFSELIAFYYTEFKPLYGHLESLNQPPLEMFFEISAAFDHLSRHWQYDVPEPEAVASAAAHLKRGCFDAYKVVLRETRKHYDDLAEVDVSIVDNGEFERNLIAAWNEIQELAIDARLHEGEARQAENWGEPFERWRIVYIKCREFDLQFYLSPHVTWARRRQTGRRWKRRIEGVCIGVAGCFVFWLLLRLLGGG